MAMRKKYGWYIVLAVYLIFLLGPIYWLFCTSFKYAAEVYNYPPTFYPHNLSLVNFVEGWTRAGAKGLTDSLIVGLSCMIISLVLALPSAYSLARYKTGGKNLAFWILSVRMFPLVAVIIPLFIMLRDAGLIDTHIGLVGLHCLLTVPFSIWVLKGFYEKIPVELEEAALVDGCTRLGIFLKVALPLVKLGIVPAALFSFIFSWDEFFFAVIFSRTEVETLPKAIQGLTLAQQVEYGQIAAVAIIAAMPAIILALFLQQYLVRGLTYGAVKG